MIIAIVTTLPALVYADDGIEPMRASEYIISYSAVTEAAVGTNDEAIVYFSISAPRAMDELGVTKISLYRSTTKTGQGSLVENYYPTGANSDWIEHNLYHHNGQLKIKVTPGYWYYAEVSFIASDKLGSDSRIVETDRAWI